MSAGTELSARIATLEARIAELTAEAQRVHSVRYDDALTSIRAQAHAARDDLGAAAARIAELERERDAAREQCRVASLNYSSVDRRLVAEQLRGEHDRHAARADLDEAVGLLRRYRGLTLLARAPQNLLEDANAYLARHPTPDKETT